MANLNADAILTAVRGVIDSGSGAIRTVSSSRFDGGLYDDLSPDEQSRRALTAPVFETGIRVVGRNQVSPPIMGTYQLLDVEVAVTVVRHLNADHKLDDSLRDDIKALAAEDADILFQALTWPGNLTQTSGAVATGLVGGCLRYVGSSAITVSLSDNNPGRVTTTHTFNGIVKVTTAIS